MLLLTSTSDKVQLVTSAAGDIDVHATWVDNASGTITPGRTNTGAITTATTTDVVGSPGASTQRNVQSLIVNNVHASVTNTVTVRHTDGSTPVDLIVISLAAGETLQFIDGVGWQVLASSGAAKTTQNFGNVAYSSSQSSVVLGSDVTNNNATANTIADVTGLSFGVTSGNRYYFRFIIPYTAAATTTGSRWTISGPAAPTLLNYRSTYTLTATSETNNAGVTAYDTPSSSSASSLTAGNVAIIEGIIQPSANGTVIARFASEISSSAIVAKAGAVCYYHQIA